MFQRVRENETSLQQLSTEREERERERWSLLRHARDEAERSLSLAAQLNAKELQLQQTQEQLQDVSKTASLFTNSLFFWGFTVFASSCVLFVLVFPQTQLQVS